MLDQNGTNVYGPPGNLTLNDTATLVVDLTLTNVTNASKTYAITVSVNDTLGLEWKNGTTNVTTNQNVTVNMSASANATSVSFPFHLAPVWGDGDYILPRVALGGGGNWTDAYAAIRMVNGTTPPGSNSTFVMSNLKAPNTIGAGTPFTVSVDVTNVGAADGIATAIFLVDGLPQGTTPVLVPAGAKETTVFPSISFSVAGAHTVSAMLPNGAPLAPQTVAVTPVPPPTIPTHCHFGGNVCTSPSPGPVLALLALAGAAALVAGGRRQRR
jgi:hypothetical protein